MGGLRLPAGCDGNTIVLSTSTDGMTWTHADARARDRASTASFPAIAADPATPGRIVDRDVCPQLVERVRASRSARSASRSRARATAALTGRSRSASTAVAPRYTWIAVAGGQFVGDYIGATFAGGRFVPVFALASKPSARGRLREYMLAASLP